MIDNDRHEADDMNGPSGSSADMQTAGLLSSAFAGVSAGHSAERVYSRARALRRRHAALPALAVLGAGAVLSGMAFAGGGATAPTAATGVAPKIPGSQRARTAAAVPLLEDLHVQDAAFDISTDTTTGVVTVTPKQAFNPGELQQILTAAGIRNDIQVFAPGVPSPASCTAPAGLHSLNVAGVVVSSPRGSEFSFDPSAMPPGSYLVVEFIQAPGASSPMGVGVGLLNADPHGCAPQLASILQP
jgi:hypothetical protein